MKINNIILDFGGILYKIDYMQSVDSLKKLSETPTLFDEFDIKKIQNLPEMFEKGLVSTTEFRQAVKSNYNLTCSDSQFDDAWNSMLLGVAEESTFFLRTLKSKYNLAMLSNTNSIHYDYFSTQIKNIETEIEHIYYSHELGMRKPNHDVYKYILQKHNYSAEQTLFIDDTKENTDAAKELGIHTINHKRNGNLSELLHSIENYSQT